jgi:hypothetical protein
VTAPVAPRAGENVQAVRDALEQLRDGSGDYEAVKEAVQRARFATRPAARTIQEIAADWDYTPVRDSFTDTVSVARWRRVLTAEQERELKGLARFVGPDPTRMAQPPLETR